MKTILKPDTSNWRYGSIECPKLGPSDCRSRSCEVCGVKYSLTVARAVGDRTVHGAMITLTQFGSRIFQDVQGAYNSFLRRYRREMPIETVWVVEGASEPIPGVNEVHIHAIATGIPDEDLLITAACSAGFGPRVSISPTKSIFTRGANAIEKGSSGVRYLFKYLDHPIGTPESVTAFNEHLALNGNRVQHHTKQFFGGTTLLEVVQETNARRNSFVAA